MLVAQKFKEVLNQSGDAVFARKGVIGSLVIPEAIKKLENFEADIVNNQIVMGQGQSIQVITDKFALATNLDEVEANIFFINGGMVIELISGQIILFGANDEQYILHEDGEISYPKSRVRTRIVTVEDLRSNAEIVIRARYGLTSTKEASDYLNNLLINVVMSYKAKDADPCLSVRLDAIYEDLGNNEFNFRNYAEEAARAKAAELSLQAELAELAEEEDEDFDDEDDDDDFSPEEDEDDE